MRVSHGLSWTLPTTSGPVSLSPYTRTYEAHEYCRLVSNRQPIDVELDSSPRHIARQGNSEKCFQLIDSWINKCVADHTPCTSTDMAPLPTRVIDVGNTIDGETARLIECKGAFRKYSAPSHCWGGGYLPKTLRCIPQLDAEYHIKNVRIPNIRAVPHVQRYYLRSLED